MQREKWHEEVSLETGKADFLGKTVVLPGSVKYPFMFILVSLKWNQSVLLSDFPPFLNKWLWCMCVKVEYFSSTRGGVLPGKWNRRREEWRVWVIQWEWLLLGVRRKTKMKVMDSEKWWTWRTQWGKRMLLLVVAWTRGIGDMLHRPETLVIEIFD